MPLRAQQTSSEIALGKQRAHISKRRNPRPSAFIRVLFPIKTLAKGANGEGQKEGRGRGPCRPEYERAEPNLRVHPHPNWARRHLGPKTAHWKRGSCPGRAPCRRAGRDGLSGHSLHRRAGASPEGCPARRPRGVERQRESRPGDCRRGRLGRTARPLHHENVRPQRGLGFPLFRCLLRRRRRTGHLRRR